MNIKLHCAKLKMGKTLTIPITHFHNLTTLVKRPSQSYYTSLVASIVLDHITLLVLNNLRQLFMKKNIEIKIFLKLTQLIQNRKIICGN